MANKKKTTTTTNSKPKMSKKPADDAKTALHQMKLEIANELGISNYSSTDKGNLTSRQNGYVGGYMVKKLVESAQKDLAKK